MAKPVIWLLLSVGWHLITLSLCVGLVVLSGVQIPNHRITSSKTTISNGGNEGNDACSFITTLKDHRPIQYTLNSDPGLLGCSWANLQTGIRMVVAVSAALVTVLSVYLFHIKRSRLSYLYAILLLLAAGAFFYVLLIDTKSVVNSYSWCHDKMSGMTWGVTPTEIHCSFVGYAVVCVLDGCAVASFVIMACFAVKYLWVANAIKQQQQLTSLASLKPVDDATSPTDSTPLVGGDKQKHSKEASSIGPNDVDFSSASQSSQSSATSMAAAAATISSPSGGRYHARHPSASPPIVVGPPPVSAFDFEALSRQNSNVDFEHL